MKKREKKEKELSKTILRNIIIIAFLLPLLNCCVSPEKKDVNTPLDANVLLLEKAEKIHKAALTLDSHADVPLRFLDPEFDINKRNEASAYCKVDFPRMKEGDLDAAFFAVFVGQGERSPEGNAKVKESALSIFEAIISEMKKSTAVAEIALTPADAYRLEKEGKRAIYLGVENGYAIGTDTANIREFYNLGTRYITLCHTKNNDICDSSNDKIEHNGLSDFGKKVLAKMNELGIMVDVSHASDKSFYDVIELSKVPVIASHSCARVICDERRNFSDDMLKKLAENGGVIQMCIFSNYVKTIEPDTNRINAQNVIREKYNNFKDLSDEEYKKGVREWHALDKVYPPNLATVSDLVDHIDHIVKVIGVDYIGIGTDFDGGGGLEDCIDVSQIKNITIELVKRGYTEAEIKKIWGGNFMRVFSEVQEQASEIQ